MPTSIDIVRDIRTLMSHFDKQVHVHRAFFKLDDLNAPESEIVEQWLSRKDGWPLSHLKLSVHILNEMNQTNVLVIS